MALGIFLQTTNTIAAVAGDTLNQVKATVTEAVNTGIATAPKSEESFSLISMIAKGGVMMIPLGILLVLTIYVCIERLLAINKAAKGNSAILGTVREQVLKGDLSAAINTCKMQATPEGAMLEKGVSRIGQPMQEIREAMVEAAGVELNALEKNLSILNITGRIAPMFGFVGTIIGVIKIFYDIALARTVEIEVISTGLYQKMITSAGGLVVGVLAFIAYHWMNARIDKISHRMEETKMRFLDILNEPSK